MEIKGIREAVRDYNMWQGAARIYYDPSDCSVWCNIYTSPGWWDEYDDPNIVQVASKATNDMRQRNYRISKRKLEELIGYAVSTTNDYGVSTTNTAPQPE